MVTLCLGQKCGKIDQKSNLSKIQFIIDAIFDIHIKKKKEGFVSKNVKSSGPPYLHWVYSKLNTKFQ